MARGSFERKSRVASVIRATVAELIARRVKDPRVSGVTIIECEVTGDLREARIFYSTHGDRDAAATGLARASGFLRRELGKQLKMRNTPSLTFTFDGSLEYGARIEAHLKNLGLGQGQTADDEPEPDGAS